MTYAGAQSKYGKAGSPASAGFFEHFGMTWHEARMRDVGDGAAKVPLNFSILFHFFGGRSARAFVAR